MIIEQEKSTEILINCGLHETRVALLENGLLQEVFIERSSNQSIVDNIYKGKVVRVLPGMDAAFIDIGLEKNAFLHVKNIAQANHNNEDKSKITDHLRQGETIIVQVLKEQIGNKGARLSTDISIPSRYVVFLPNSTDIGVSAKIEDDETRNYLRSCIHNFTEGFDSGGYIVRTAIENTDDWALRSDIQYLHKIWGKIKEKSKDSKPGSVLYQGFSLPLRVLRDYVDESVSSIYVDSKDVAREMEGFVQDFFPEKKGIIKYHKSNRPIFDLYSVDDEIERALKRKVNLKSGGHLVIDQTEAMTTIDVNTGKFVGLKNHAETIFKTNLEASKSIARQLRLRNLGGIIIIDFIDMLSESHQKAVIKLLTDSLDSGHGRYTIEPMSSLGLLEMTRKRTRESLGHTLCETCPTCSGRGYIKTIETVAYEIIREVIREVDQFKPKEVILITSHEVNDYLGEDEPDLLANLEEKLHIPIKLQTDHYYGREYYDIALL